jgi:O-antigen ligase
MLLPLSYAMLRSGSRSALLSLAITAVYAFLHLPGRKKLMLVLIALLVSPLLIALLPGHIVARLGTTFSSRDELGADATSLEHSAVSSTESRWYLFKQSVLVTMQNPIFGVGAGNFLVAENDMAIEAGRRGAWRMSHNGYTQVSSELGIIGLVLYSGAIVSCWRKLKRMGRGKLPDAHAPEIRHTVFSLQLSVMAMLVAAVFGLSFYGYYLPAFLGLIVGLDRCVRKMQGGLQEKVPVAPAWTARPMNAALRP